MNRHGVRLAALLACLILGGAATAATPARCVSLEVPAPFVLPDGTLHAAGPLRLCFDEDLSPVTGLHRVYVGGQPAGYCLSRNSTPEASTNPTPYAIFYPDRGRLRLIGYTVAYEGKTYSYRLRGSGVTAAAVSATKRAGAADAPATESARAVFLAAQLS